MHTRVFHAGASATDLTPSRSMFLYGYPHVARDSTGVHDPLECAALYLSDGSQAALILANDLIHLSKRFVAGVRREIAAATGVPEEVIMITATHTHSGPIMVDHVSNAADATVPRVDRAYVAWAADRMVSAARAAVAAAQPAEVTFTLARAEGVGTNRHDPAGPADPEVPFLTVRRAGGGAAIAALLVYGMHPTVLHEDSTLVSSDFPHYTRRFLQDRVLGAKCPVLYLSGAAGNQSPRHVTRGNTFSEAQRLGELLGEAIRAAQPRAAVVSNPQIRVRRTAVELATRAMPSLPSAEQAVTEARARFDRLRAEKAPRPAVRTAECDVFGAEETAELARAATDGRLAAAAAECSPAEVQLVQIGPWKFIAWPGEFFVEYALEVKRESPDTYVVTLANGELQAYIVTPEAAQRGSYEARNAIFSPENGSRVVQASLALLRAGS